MGDRIVDAVALRRLHCTKPSVEIIVNERVLKLLTSPHDSRNVNIKALHFIFLSYNTNDLFHDLEKNPVFTGRARIYHEG